MGMELLIAFVVFAGMVLIWGMIPTPSAESTQIVHAEAAEPQRAHLRQLA